MNELKDLVALRISPKKASSYLRVLYLLWAIIGMFALVYVPGELLVDGNTSETVQNIVENEALFRSGIAAALITQIFQIVMVLLLFQMFRGVSRRHNVLLVIFALVGVPISMVSTLGHAGVLVVINESDSFSPEQIESLVTAFLNLNEFGIAVASIFWGLWLFPLGYLAYKSKYFPKLGAQYPALVFYNYYLLL